MATSNLAGKESSQKNAEREGEEKLTPPSPTTSSQGWQPDWSLGTPPSQPLSQISPSSQHLSQLNPPSQPLLSSSQPFSQPASLTQPDNSSSGSQYELSLPSQIHYSPIDQSPTQSEFQPNSQASQPCQHGILDPPESKPVLHQTSLSNQIEPEAESSICSTQAPTISQQSSSSQEMSRISQEIAVQERMMDVKGWREDEKEREEEKQSLGLDGRKEALLYQRDTMEEKQKGWI